MDPMEGVVSIPPDPNDPPAESIKDQAEPTDRDERRIVASQRFFRRILAEERRIGVAALRRLSSAIHSDPPSDER